MPRFDVAIVGAGPAGSWAACRLARQGVRTALIDGSHPREKPCGGGVTGRALALVRDVVTAFDGESVPIASASFESGSRAARVAIPAAYGLTVLPRRVFDGTLLSAAISAGAEFIPARVTSIGRGDCWHLATQVGVVEAEWLLGGDGANSLVRRTVSRRLDREDLSIGTGYFVHGSTAREIAIAFEPQPGGYLWSFPRADHLAVGVCAQADESSASGLLAVARRWIEVRHDAPTSALERYSWPIPSLRATTLEQQRLAGSGWMLLGDAAGLVDPITREGIYFALKSAEVAAQSLVRPGNPRRRYERDMRGTILWELVRAARLKARFFDPRFTTLFVSALERSSRIRSVAADLVAGEQPYRGLRRRLAATFEVRLMLEFLMSR